MLGQPQHGDGAEQRRGGAEEADQQPGRSGSHAVLALRSSAVSTSRRRRSSATRRRRKLASVSASAWSVDQRTAGEGLRRPARAEADQPVAAILGRAEHRIGPAEGAEGGGDIGRAEAGDVAADQHRPAMPAAAPGPCAGRGRRRPAADASAAAPAGQRARSGVTASSSPPAPVAGPAVAAPAGASWPR